MIAPIPGFLNLPQLFALITLETLFEVTGSTQESLFVYLQRMVSNHCNYSRHNLNLILLFGFLWITLFKIASALGDLILVSIMLVSYLKSGINLRGLNNSKHCE